MKYGLLIFLLLFSFRFALAQPPQKQALSMAQQYHTEIQSVNSDYEAYLKQELRFKLPQYSVEELKQALQSGEELILIDARSEKAYAYGHIAGARRVGLQDFTVEDVWMLGRKSPIIIYCNVGKRSEALGEQLLEMGFQDIRNLYGSIIEWVNQGGELENAKGKASRKIGEEGKAHIELSKKWLNTRKYKLVDIR